MFKTTLNNNILPRMWKLANIVSISGTIMKSIANYIKGRKAYTTYTTYRNHTFRRQFKTGVPQGSVLSPTLFNYTADLIQPRAPVQVMFYADDITSRHTNTSAANKYIQPYLYKVAWTKHNNITLNADKTTDL